MLFDQSTARLSSRDEDGFIRIQPDPYGSQDPAGPQGSAQNYEAFLPFGLGGRPKAPTNGAAANVLVLRQGDDTMVLPGHDPRWMSARPDFGDGGATLCACTELAGNRVAPYIAIFGEGGAAAEGLFRISVPSSAGTTTIEIDPSTGDVTITHPNGTTVHVKASGVELGAAGGFNVVVDNGALAAWASAVVSGLAGLGVTVPALAGYAATKVKAT